MIDINGIIKDKPLNQKLHILESMIHGFYKSFEGRKMPPYSESLYLGMQARYYGLKDETL